MLIYKKDTRFQTGRIIYTSGCIQAFGRFANLLSIFLTIIDMLLIRKRMSRALDF